MTTIAPSYEAGYAAYFSDEIVVIHAGIACTPEGQAWISGWLDAQRDDIARGTEPTLDAQFKGAV